MLRVFGHHIPRSLLLLLVLEALTLLRQLRLARAWSTTHSLADVVNSLRRRRLLPAAVLLGTMQTGGAARRSCPGRHARDGGAPCVGAFGVGRVWGCDCWLPPGSARGHWTVDLGGGLLALALITVERLCLFRWMFCDRFRRRVLVLGSGARAQEIEQLIDGSA